MVSHCYTFNTRYKKDVSRNGTKCWIKEVVNIARNPQHDLITVHFEDGYITECYRDELIQTEIMGMDKVWKYEVDRQAIGIVFANSELDAIEKVVASYKKHNDEICPADVEVVKATESGGYFSDCPDILEVCYIDD